MAIGIFNSYTTKREFKTYKIRKFDDVDEIDNFVTNIDWSVFDDESGNVDDLTRQIYNTMNKFMDDLCPQIEVTSKYEPVPWMSNEIKELMAKRKIFYDRWCINRKHQSADVISDSYHQIDNRVKHTIRSSKRELFIVNYGKARDLNERWKLIHRFGVTKKSKKMEAYNMVRDDKFTLEKFN